MLKNVISVKERDDSGRIVFEIVSDYKGTENVLAVCYDRYLADEIRNCAEAYMKRGIRRK